MRIRQASLLALAVAVAAASLAAQSSPATIGGALPPLFPADNWWNQDVSQAPLAAESPAIIAFINNGGTRRLHPDFGGIAAPHESYGIPYVVVAGDQPKRQVQFYYASESDGVGMPFYPIPDQARTEPYWIEGGAPGNQAPGGDRHMLIVDRDHRRLYELYDLAWSGTQWTAGSGAAFDLQTNGRRPDGWTSADAAGLAILPGLVRYDEVYGPDEIDHAFRVTVRATNSYYVWPASHVAGSTPAAPPNGTRLRLKASKDLSAFPPAAQKIFRAMKKHGLIVADNGSDMYVSGAFDPRWDNGVLNPAFRGLTASDFEVVQLGWRGSSQLPPACTPTAPTDLWASVSGYTVQLGWTAPASAWLGHLIDVGSQPGLTDVTSIPLAAPATALGGPVAAGRYYVRARAAEACGTSAASNEVIVDVPAGCALPAAPGPLSFAVGAGRTVALGWGTAGSATSYVLEAGSASGLANILVTDVGAARSISTTAPPGRYYVRVRGRGTCGQTGPASNEAVIVVP